MGKIMPGEAGYCPFCDPDKPLEYPAVDMPDK